MENKKLFILFFVFVVFVGISLLVQSLLNDNNRNYTEQTFSSEDGVFFITVPRGWVQLFDYELNDVAQIQARNRRTNSFLVVITDSQEDFDDYNFERTIEIVKENLLAGWRNHTILSAIDTLIDEQPARQYEIEGSIDGTKAVMLATYIDGEKYFAQVLTWTIASRYKTSEKEFRAITNSVRGLN